jgi:hypothetical protein
VKRFLVLLALLGVLAAPGRLAAQSIPVGIGGQLSSALHVPIVVPVIADLSARPERLGSFSLRIQWNPAVLELTGGGDGTFGDVQVNEDSLALGVARLAGVNPAGVTGRVTLVNLQLVPLVKDTTTLTLTLSGLYAAGTFADLDSLAVVSNAVFCPARGLWGDIDGDGNANSRDALIALSNAVGLDVSAFDIGLGDVDGNGLTNARDALIVLSNAVGVDVSAYRVLRIAGGACSGNAGVAMSVTPAAVELVLGQKVALDAWVADSVTGALQSVPNPTWKSSDPMVLVVGPDGRAEGRDTGTAVVTALRGTRDSAQATVHIVARRSSHWVDAAAVNAKNQLGTTDLPFGSIEDGRDFAQDDDTLRIRVGSYELRDGTLYLGRPIVLIGDTAADGSRPLLVPDSGRGGYDGDAIDIWGPGRREVQYLAIDGARTGVYMDGVDCVLLRGVRMHVIYSGVYMESPTHCLRIEHSAILGPEAPYDDAPPVHSPVARSARSADYYSSGPAVQVDGPLDTLTIEDTEIGGFYYGVELSMLPDSTTIRRSSLHDFIYGAVTSNGGDICYDCVAPNGQQAALPAARPRPVHAASARVTPSAMDGVPVPAAVVIESSRLERSSYSSLVSLEGYFRRVAFAHNRMSNPGRDAVNVYSSGPSGVGGYLSLLGDSIVAPPENQHNSWLNAQYLDSLVMDSVQAVGFVNGYTYDVPLVRMTNSTLRDLQGSCGECTGTALEVDFGYSVGQAGGVLQLANDSVVGDPRDDARGYAFVTYGARVEADRVTVVNVDRGIYAEYEDSSVTVTNSLFRHVSAPIVWYPESYPAPYGDSLTVRGTTFSGFDVAISVENGGLTADSNTFVGGNQAIYFDSPSRATVTRNQATGLSSGLQINSYDSTAVVTVTDNVFTGIQDYGVSAWGANYQDPVQTLFDVRRNTVTCDASGATDGAGLDLGSAHLVVLDNQVSGCWAGIRTFVSMPTARGDSVVGNTVTVPPSAQLGISVAGNVRARVGRNTVTGAASGQQQAGLIDVFGNCELTWACPEVNVPFALVDSNIVTGGTLQGIHANAVDSLQIVGNTVTNLNSPSSGYSETWGGISVSGYLQYLARIVGNVVKHVAWNGIAVIRQYGDTSTVVVDSNVVASADSSGIYVQSTGYDSYSAFAITRNLLTLARRDGIRIGGEVAGPVTITANNITGNLPFGADVFQGDRGTVNAEFNWWGDALGPSCSSGCTGVSGDSVSSSYDFDVSNFLTAPNDTTAPTVVPAPRFLARARPAPVVRTVRLSGRADAPIAARDRWAAPRAPALRPAAANAQPATGPMAERRAAAERDRAQRAVDRAQRLQQLRAQVEARERAQRAAHAPPRAARSQGVRP